MPVTDCFSSKTISMALFIFASVTLEIFSGQDSTSSIDSPEANVDPRVLAYLTLDQDERKRIQH